MFEPDNKTKIISTQFYSQNKDYYITLIARILINNKEELLINYGAVELKSHNYIIILSICAGCIFLIGVIIGIVCLCRKRRQKVTIGCEEDLIEQTYDMKVTAITFD